MAKLMQYSLFTLFCITIIPFHFVLAKATIQKSSQSIKKSSTLEQALKKYSTYKLVQMDVLKTVKSEMMGRETKYNGKMALTKGKFRWENMSPEHTLLVFDGQNIFNVVFPDPRLQSQTQVSKSKLNGNGRKQLLVSALMDPSVFKKRFKVGSEVHTDFGKKSQVELLPASDDLAIERLSVKLENKNIVELSYKDDIGNIVTMNFKNIRFLNSYDRKMFEYRIPSGAQVNNL